VRQFRDDLPVDRGLRVHKALEVERIAHAATPSTVTRTGLSAMPDSLPTTTVFRMPIRTIELPKNGFALEIDGRLKTEFSTKEGAEQGAIELKRRFPMLQIRIYDAASQSRHDLPL
jgi:hypothetical protein